MEDQLRSKLRRRRWRGAPWRMPAACRPYAAKKPAMARDSMRLSPWNNTRRILPPHRQCWMTKTAPILPGKAPIRPFPSRLTG